MEAKELIAIFGSIAVIVAGVFMTFVFPRLRDVLFCSAIFGIVVSDRLDINFVSREWYRGTTRGFEFSFVDCLFLIVLLGGLLRSGKNGRRIYLPPGLIPVLIFTLYCCWNVLSSSPYLFGLFELSKLLRGLTILLCVSFYIRSTREVRIMVLAILFPVAYEALLAFHERYFLGIHRVHGTLHHANSLSMYLCMTIPVLLCCLKSIDYSSLKRFATLGITVVASLAVILTISRSGVATLIIVSLLSMLFCVSLKVTVRKILYSSMLVFGVAAVLVLSLETLQSRYGEASLTDEYFGEETAGRGVYLRLAELILADRPLGVGLNNWSYHVTNTYAPKLGMFYEPYSGASEAPSQEVPYLSGLEAAQAAPAHNLLAITAGELGWPGLAIFLCIWLRWFGLGVRFFRRKHASLACRLGLGVSIGLLAVFLQSLTEWEFRQTPIFFMVHVYAGILASLVYFRRKGVFV